MRVAPVFAAAVLLATTTATAGEIPPAIQLQQRLAFSLESIVQRARALGKISSISVIDSPLMPRKFDLAGSGNIGRTMRLLSRAQSHLLLGDPARAEALVESELSNINEFSPGNATDFLRVLYESRRLQEKWFAAAETCQTWLAQGGRSADMVQSCAHTMTRVTVPSPTGTEPVSEARLASFAYARPVRDLRENRIPVAILLMTAFQNLNKPQEATDYLERTLGEVSPKDPWYARGTLTLALCRLQNGWREKGTRALRRLVEETSTDDIVPAAVVVDPKTKGLAALALGRIFFTGGYIAEAKRHYENAVAQLQIRIPPPSTRIVALGIVEEAGPARPLSLDTTSVSVDSVREEARNLFCVNNDGASCPSEFEPTALQSVAVLPEEPIRRGYLNNAPKGTLTALLGRTEADLDYLEAERKKGKRRSPESLVTDTESIAAIARFYAHQSETLVSLQAATIHSVATRKNADLAGRQLTQALTPVVKGYAESEPAHQGSQKRFADLLNETNTQLLQLDTLTRARWNLDATTTATADEHRAVLAKRLQSLADPLLHLARKAREKQEPQRFAELNRKSRELAELMATEQARLAGVKMLASASEVTPDLGKAVDLTEAHLEKLTRDSLAVELRIRTAMLIGQNPNSVGLLLLERTEKSRSTAKTYLEVHQRFLQRASTKVDVSGRELKAITLLWQKTIEAYDAIVEGIALAEERNNAERRVIESEVQQALRKKLDLEISAIKLTDKLREKAREQLPDALTALVRTVTATRDEIRLVLALAEQEKIHNTKQQQEAILRAKEERKHWIESLNESLHWELGR
jgi:hypothetical protein